LIHPEQTHRPDAASHAKPALRAAAMARRDALPPHERAARSELIAERCRVIVIAATPRCLAGYLPIRSEVDPRPVLAAAHAAGIDIVLPAVVDPTTIIFRRWRPGEALVAGRHGTLAPPLSAPILEPDLILVPLVGFDQNGARLGHGLGFYDRALGVIHDRGHRPPLVGLAFSVQEVPHIPHEPHDIRLDWIVTETATLDFTTASA
jgi:5-formyltetrahydrofolate cyclo-ligase